MEGDSRTDQGCSYVRPSSPHHGPSPLLWKLTHTLLLNPDRKKVLKHHPDKKVTSATPPTNSLLQFSGINTNDDAFFKCIQKAHEVLNHSEKRRQFDSVDPQLVDWEEDLPTQSSIKVCYTPIHHLIDHRH